MPCCTTVSDGKHADGCSRAAVRRIGLANHDVGDVGLVKLVSCPFDLGLVGYSQDDDVDRQHMLASVVTARIDQRLSSGVRDLSREVAEGQIPANDYVLGKPTAVVVAACSPV